jgi:tetratricopeptide (TPR) repeat protein
VSESERLEAEGDTFAASAMLVEAARAYEKAAHGYLEAGRDSDAVRAQLRLATLLTIVGAYSEALANIERALELETASDARELALVMKGEVLDALGDDRAVIAWTQALQKITTPMLRHLATAHVLGSSLQRGEQLAIGQLRITLDRLPELKIDDRIECVGAAALSARDQGTSLLAQAVVAIARHPEAWSFKLSSVWQALVERCPHLAVDLCALGSRLTLRRMTESDHGLLMARVELVIQRIANARGIGVDALLTQIAEEHDQQRMLDGLLALIPDEHWVVPL